MKLLKITFVLALLGFLGTKSAYAKLKIPVGEREVLIKVYDLPDTEDYLIKDGHYLDLATLHSEYSVAYILPLYVVKDPILVGYDEKEDMYYELTDEQLNEILVEEKVEKASLISLPFFTKHGGKIVGTVLIALIIFGYLPSKKKKVQTKEI